MDNDVNRIDSLRTIVNNLNEDGELNSKFAKEFKELFNLTDAQLRLFLLKQISILEALQQLKDKNVEDFCTCRPGSCAGSSKNRKANLDCRVRAHEILSWESELFSFNE